MPDASKPTEIDLPAGDEGIVMPMCSIFRRFLKGQGLKFTAERAKILDAVISHDGLFEAEQLIDEMRDSGQRASKATVYRTLKHLVDARIIREIPIDSKTAHYQVVTAGKPIDYLIDVDTDEVIEFTAPELIELRNAICRKHGLDPVGHRFLVYGVRPDSTDEDS